MHHSKSVANDKIGSFHIHRMHWNLFASDNDEMRISSPFSNATLTCTTHKRILETAGTETLNANNNDTPLSICEESWRKLCGCWCCRLPWRYVWNAKWHSYELEKRFQFWTFNLFPKHKYLFKFIICLALSAAPLRVVSYDGLFWSPARWCLCVLMSKWQTNSNLNSNSENINNFWACLI